MSHEAYKKASAQFASPREAEYQAFSAVTQKLIEVADRGREDLRALINAIHMNRQLWGALASDCGKGENGLPMETRAQIISLARWVDSYSSDVMRKDESVEPLVDVNRIIMEGLAGAKPAA